MNAESLRSRLSRGETAYGAWSVIPSAISVLSMAKAGLDYVVIDLQHGGATEHDLPPLTEAIRRAGATPLGRVRYAHPADIGRALDLGCDGVIIPNVDSTEHAFAVAGACRYPPAGYRSAGGIMIGQEEPLCLVMVESRQAIDELEATLALSGVDGIYVGPRDLSLALGCALDPDDPVMRRQLERVWAACAEAGKPVGVHATDGGIAGLYRDNGCRLVTVISDAVAVTRGAAHEFAVARGRASRLVTGIR